MPEMHFLQDLLVLFGLGIVAVVAFHRLNLPPVLGFLITGVVCGPFGFRLVSDGQAIEALAEIGLVLLLFTIGIEFSVKTFLRLKKFLLIAGGLQILLTIAAGAAITHWIGLPWATSVFLGMLASLSSTAIVIRILEYRGDLDSAHGRSALSILIFQDLCIVPMVLIAPFLGGKGGNLLDVALLSGKALLFLLAAGTIARWLVPWFLNQVAKTKKREAFVLSIILLCLGTATATSHFGLSMALGAFIAGLVLSESKFSHQALGEVLPFREVFNCLVFVSIGMLFDVRELLANPVMVVAALAIVILVKAFIGAGVTAVMGHSLRVAILTGFALAQISEFSFVLAKIGLNAGLLDASTNQLFLAVAILSMFLTPASLSGGTKLAGFMERLLPRVLHGSLTESSEHDEMPTDHVIIVGYGVTGRTLAKALRRAQIPYAVIEQDPAVVRAEQGKGAPFLYGDASRQEILHHAGIHDARLIALTLSDAETVLRSAELVKRINPQTRIVARARYNEDVNALVSVGAEDVVSEELVGANVVTERVLNSFSKPN
jgi:CPA2 family monovalent cation:H+ antiporter-2